MKVICEKCESVFKAESIKGMDRCPVCGELFDDMDDFSHDTPLSFGEDVELGENDSFDEDKIDFWWYSIREPDEDGRRGRVYTTCVKCGSPSYVTYPIAQSRDYLLINPRCHDSCSNCGNELKNHILSKRPADWVDPRKRDMWAKDYKNIPKCPTCSSTKIRKISATSKVASVAMWGVLSRKVHKQWHCDTCGSEW